MPLSLINELDLVVVPPESVGDLVEAAQRLRDGDLTGALTAAAGTVESACVEIYAQKGLGDPSKVPFQEKVARCLAACSSYETILQELVGIGWETVEAEILVNNLKGALNQAAYVMQKLRSSMGDVHGRKEVYTSLVYDALKWATIIISIFPKPAAG